MSKEKMLEAFEAWVIATCENAHDYLVRINGVYVKNWTESNWKAWQACAAHYERQNEELLGIPTMSQFATELDCLKARERWYERQLAAAQADNVRLREALTKIDALRNDIIARQKIDWSAHVYPLVAILDDTLPQPLDTSALDRMLAEERKVPEGFVLAITSPTPYMVHVAVGALRRAPAGMSANELCCDMYRAMLSAAPQPEDPEDQIIGPMVFDDDQEKG